MRTHTVLYLQDMVDRTGANSAGYRFDYEEGHPAPMPKVWHVTLFNCIRDYDHPQRHGQRVQHLVLGRGAHLDVTTYVANLVAKRMEQ